MFYSILFLVLFLGFMIGVGIWAMKKTTSLNDFFLGGRNVGPWISAFAYGTTYFSAVLFIGFAGKQGWLFGWNGLWIAAGNALIGGLLAWLVLGRRTRRMSQNLEAMTMPEFLQERYEGRITKIVSAVIIFTFLLPYSASVFKGLGYLFKVNFGIPYELALGIMIGITGIYLILGGYFAITLADFIQGIIMLFGCGALMLVLFGKAGGLTEAISAVTASYPAHVPEQMRPDWLTVASLVFMTSFGVWGLPQMVQKFYAVKDEKVIPRAAIGTTLFAIVIGFTAYTMGALTHVFFKPETLPRLAGGGINFDNIIPVLLQNNLPPVLMALILLLVLSASMSTLSSLVLVSASSVAVDLYKGHINPQVSKENSLAMMRFLSAVFIVISFFIAWQQWDFIVTLMSLSWGSVAGAFMAPYVLGLFWKRGTRAGAFAGMFAGLATNIILFFVLGAKNSPLAASIAMLVPFIVMPAVSLLTKPPSPDVIKKAFDKI